MPTYEYECKKCKHSFDAFQSMKDEPLKTCPKCSNELRRLINGGTGVIFKGAGFYITDRQGKAVKGSESRKSDSKSADDSPGSSPCTGCPGAESAASACSKAAV